MIRYIRFTVLSLILAIAGTGAVSAADAAQKSLETLAKSIEKAPSVTMNFSVSSGNTVTASGKITIAGKRFAITSQNAEVFYDGASQWVFVKADNEVTITKPDASEIAESNPLSIINGYKTHYTLKTLKGQAGKHVVQLSAKTKTAAVRKAVITLDAKTNKPTQLVVTPSSGTAFTIQITDYAVGKKLPDSTFRFNKPKHPDVFINDLR